MYTAATALGFKQKVNKLEMTFLTTFLNAFISATFLPL